MTQQIYNPHRLYRSRDHQLIGGVAAGIAEFFGRSRFLIRFVIFISLLVFTLPTIVVYGLACFFVKKRPAGQSEEPEEKRFWQSMHRSPKETLNKVDEQYSSVEKRVQDMEAYLTSRSYKLDRAFDELRN